MKKELFFLLFSCAFVATAQESIYVMFATNPPKATFRMEPTTREKNVIGYFELKKDNKEDCSFNLFFFNKYTSVNSLVEVKIDTLKSVVTSEWVASQPDSLLISFFRKKEVFMILKDSIKDDRSKAYRVFYKPCEVE